MDAAWIIVGGLSITASVYGFIFYVYRNGLTQRESLSLRIESVSKELYEYKLASSQYFATIAAMSEMKREMVAALGRIEDKLDRIGERNDRNDRR